MGKNKNKNEVATTKGTEVSTEVGETFVSDISSEDCERDRIALAQSSCDYVEDGQARVGCFVNLADMEELGYKDETPLELIIVGTFKYWITTDKISRDFISKQVAVTPNDLPWEEEKNGRTVKNTYHFSYLALLPSEMQSGITVPYEMAFRNTDLQASRKINKFLKKMDQQGIAPWQKVFQLTSFIKKKGNDSWFLTKPNVGRDTTAEEIQAAKAMADEFDIHKTKAMLDQSDSLGAGPAVHAANQVAAETTEAQY